VYPIDLPDPELLGKHLLELDTTTTVGAVGHPDGLSTSLTGGGAGNALDRP
jgi:amidophosphoribosyltransferase